MRFAICDLRFGEHGAVERDVMRDEAIVYRDARRDGLWAHTTADKHQAQAVWDDACRRRRRGTKSATVDCLRRRLTETRVNSRAAVGSYCRRCRVGIRISGLKV